MINFCVGSLSVPYVTKVRRFTSNFILKYRTLLKNMEFKTVGAMVINWIRQIGHVTWADIELLKRYPKLRFSVLGVLFVPALYATIYISSMWDPESHAVNLPVAIVNLDTGTQYKGEPINVGQSLTEKLNTDRKLGFTTLDSEQSAREKVRQGYFDFALIIPADFSAKAISAEASGVGHLVVYTSEGNNYTSAGIAKKFAPEISRRLNELLNERRWGKVAEIAADSEIKVARLKEGVGALNAGAQQLSAGLSKANEGSDRLKNGLDRAEQAGTQISQGALQLRDGGLRLTDGVKQFGQGIQTMNNALPANSDLMALKEGSSQLHEGQKQLNQGLIKLEDGSMRLLNGVKELKEKSADIPVFGARVVEGAQKLEDGSTQLSQGLTAAKDGSSKLVEGGDQVNQGVARLTDGMAKLGDGIRLMHSKMPADADLERFSGGLNKMADGTGQLSQGLKQLDAGSGQLDQGLDQLDDGAKRLAAGLKTLDDAIPSKLDIPSINAAGFSSTVQTELEIAAPVQNNGAAFGSNFVPLSLWVGAVMTAFLFHFRKLPVSLQGHGAWAKAIGKMLIPSGIVLAQVLVMLITVSLVLGISVSHPIYLIVTLVTSSIIFVSIVMALVRWLGDTGKVMAVLFLILQLSSSGAIVPIELTGALFQTIHPYLPFTWVVKATKVALFDAYDGQWLLMYSKILITPLVLWPLSTYTGRWIYQPDDQYMPALDVQG